MIRVDARKPVHFCDGLTRRDFLHAGSLSVLGLGLPAMQALAASGSVAGDRDINCILLFLVGGPSQLDTWDMKPDAPEEIRGPFRPIATKVPGSSGLRDLPQAGDDDGQGVAGPLRLSHGGGRPRHGPSDDADRPAVHRRDRSSALRLRGRPRLKGSRHDTPPYVLLAATDRADRRQLAARACRRLSRQDVRSLHLERRSQRQGVQGARPAAAGLRHGGARVAAAVAALGDRRRGRRVRVVGRRPAARCQLRGGVQADVEPAGARGVRDRRRAGPRSATATAAPGSARAACWRGG